MRNGIKFGRDLLVYNHVNLKMEKKSHISIGDNFHLVSAGGYNPIGRNIESSIYLGHDAELKIGNSVGISDSVIRCSKKITIGNHVLVGANTVLLDTDAHSLDWKVRKEGGKTTDGYWKDGENAISKEIVIEDNVLIGTGCIILKGVTIGARSVIGSYSVVTKSIPEDCVASGNPCRVIKSLKK